MTKKEMLQVRVTTEEKEFILKQATENDMKTSSYILSVLLPKERRKDVPCMLREIDTLKAKYRMGEKVNLNDLEMLKKEASKLWI